MDENLSYEAEPEEIRHRIEETREALVSKLDTLESRVTEGVSEVRDNIKDSIEGVKRTFSLDHQFSAHPLTLFGSAVAGGLLIGLLIRRPLTDRVPVGSSSEIPMRSPAEAAANKGYLHRLAGGFEDEIRDLRGLAVGAVLGVARDIVMHSVSRGVAPQIDRIIDSATRKLNGTPIQSKMMAS